jgi:N-acetyl-alpha-D-glucosaminyl L-malate synthase BshA
MSDVFSIGVVCYPSLGGSGVVAVDLAAGMARRGHRVHVIANAHPWRMPLDVEGLAFERVEPTEHPVFDHPPYTLAVAAKIVEVVRRDGLDLVHSHYAVPHAAGAYVAAGTLGSSRPKLVTTVHGTDVTQLGADPAMRSITAFTVGAGDGITAPSAFLGGEATRVFDLPPAAVVVIPNFVDTERFTPAEGRDPHRLGRLLAGRTGGEAPEGPFLVHVSNFRPVKRATELLDVLATVRASIPAHLVLIGDGPERPAIRERALERGLGAHVSFVGERSDVSEMLPHADVFLLTSESEGFGVAALEALSCGVPVFAYRVGGLSEVVTAESGVLVEPFDVAALAGAVCAALADERRHDDLRRAARARAVGHFRAEPMLDRYEAYYRRVLRPA